VTWAKAKTLKALGIGLLLVTVRPLLVL